MRKAPSNFHSFISINKKTWNRKILNFSWFAFILSFFAAFFNYLFYNMGDMDYVRYAMLIPTFILLILIIVSEIICRFFKDLEDITIILASSLFVSGKRKS